jgi:putative tryptophan/tyrosine transport system substrate-binding protein
MRLPMNKLFKAVAIILFSALVFSAPAGADRSKALFLYWRGETLCETGLKKGLKELGANVDIIEFNADQDNARLNAYLAGIDEKKFAFIYTFGTTVSLETAKVIKKTPILFGIVTNPVEAGLIDSWESSGKNITGVSHAVPYKDQADFIAKLGNYKKIGIIYDPKAANANIANEELGSLLSAKAIELVGAPVLSENDFDKAVADLAAKKVDLVYLPSDSLIIAHADKLLAALNSRNIPTYGAVEALVQKGAMTGIVGSYEMVGKLLAYKAVKILQGQKPSQIPSSFLPMEMQTILVNARTAQKINATISYDILNVAKILE